VNQSQSYGASLALDTDVRCLNPSQAGQYSIHLLWRHGIDLGGWLYTKTVYLYVDNHPSK